MVKSCPIVSNAYGGLVQGLDACKVGGLDADGYAHALDAQRVPPICLLALQDNAEVTVQGCITQQAVHEDARAWEGQGLMRCHACVTLSRESGAE